MREQLRKLIPLISLVLFLFFIPQIALAQNNQSSAPTEEKLEAIIVDIKEEKEININRKKQIYQKIELLFTNGSLKGKKIITENGNIPIINAIKFKIGEKVIVTASKNFENKDYYYITDYVRRDSLYWLFAIFVGLTIIIGRRQGISSLIGMIFSFFVIFTFVLPQISSGKDPIFIAIIASVFIIPVTFFLSHGLNRKTTAAVIGTTIALIVTGILANIFVDAARLTGFASEEASFVEAANPGLVNIRGLLLAGIIIGVLGILDDITISQSAVVHQLKKASQNLSPMQLYSKAMDVGKDHIASVVNTLILIYTGAALPLLLLFINSPTPFSEVINYEILSEEIVRTLVASIGLILAVPITTFIAAYSIKKSTNQ